MRKMLLLVVAGVVTFMAGASFAAQSATGWHFVKLNPKTKKLVVVIDAKSFMGTEEPHSFRLQDMTARLYDGSGSSYKTINSKEAIINEKLHTLTYGAKEQTVVTF
jgi:hypothetical protein